MPAAIAVDGAPTPTGSLLAPGALIDGRYRIESYLGGGGMASVYRATHVALEQTVAIKVISLQLRNLPGMAERFLREARAATHLKSEHVARVSDVGTMADGAPYMVMEFLDGSDLSVVLDPGDEIPIEDAVDFILQGCEALAEVHGLGIVHRDLKPANLFLTRGADGLPCVKLIDFGICGPACTACPVPAGGTATCVNNACGTTCPATSRLCGGNCVAKTDPAACGAPCVVCVVPPNAAAKCAADACGFTCTAGFANCDANPATGCETNLATDPAHCGMCGKACAVGLTCVTGVCL